MYTNNTLMYVTVSVRLCVELNDFGSQLIVMIAINNRELDHSCYPYLCLVKIWTTKANTIALKFRKL